MALVVREYGPWWAECPSAPPPIEPLPLTSKDAFAHRDFFEVRFAEPVLPVAIEIYETYNPGSVVRVLARPARPEKWGPGWAVLWTGSPELGLPAEARIKRICFADGPAGLPKFRAADFRVEIDSACLGYYAEFDAVKLVGRVSTPGPASLPPSSQNADAVAKRANSTLFHRVLRARSKDRDGSGELEPLLSDESATAVSEAAADLEQMTLTAAPTGADTPAGIDVLPDELLIAALCRLRIVDQLAASCVSQRWYFLASSAIHSRTNLDLQLYSHLAEDRFLFHLGPKLRAIRRLSLSWCGSNAGALATAREGGDGQGAPAGGAGGGVAGRGLVTGAGFQFLAPQLGGLVVLRLACCSWVDDSVLALVIRTCPVLGELNLSRCACVSSDGLAQLGGLTRLTRLNLYNTNVDPTSLEAIAQGCQLAHLNLGHCSRLNMPGLGRAAIAALVARSGPTLVSLDVWFWKSIDTAEVVALAEGCPNLEELDLGWAKTVDASAATVALARNCPKLRKLFLTSMRGGSDEALAELAAGCPELVQLDLLGWNRISPDVVENVLTHCPKLAFLDLSFCSLLDIEFVEGLRGRFPVVDIKRSFA